LPSSTYSAPSSSSGVICRERLAAAVDLVADDPQAGVIVQGTGGCRKVRLAGRGKGKSGGYRIIFAFGGSGIPVFLITVFGKGEKDNLGKAERNELAKLTKVLFETCGRKPG
jgi:hypothetical protein